ncbi:MAG: rhodanese-like domain-containing protein [Spirochaetia bacterium]|jgi:rhodanese-related sulfurtransferase
MRPWLLSFSLILLLCGAAAFAAPVISADNSSYSISIQAAGAVVKHVFDVTNTGDQTLEITDMLASCTCTTVTPTKAELAPRKSIGIAVSVDTTGFTGLTERTVTLESNDPANPDLVLLISVTVAGKAQAKLPTITAAEFQKRFYLLVDVRTPEEFASGHLFGAVNIPLSEFQNNLSTWTPRLPRDVPIILQCKSGSRSAQATQILLNAGFTNVLNLDGGITDWADIFGPRYLFGF